MIRFSIHASIYASNVEVLCPPNLIKEVTKKLESIECEGVEIVIFESAVKELLKKSKPEVEK